MEFLAPKLNSFIYFFRKSLFSYFRKRNFLALRTFRAKKIKKSTPKKFLIFSEMELSSLKLKELLFFLKNLIFFSKNCFSYISGRNLQSLKNKNF